MLIKAKEKNIDDVDFDAIAGEIKMIADEEEDKFNNLSEGLQSSEKGATLQAAAENLNDAADSLESDNDLEAIEKAIKIIDELL